MGMNFSYVRRNEPMAHGHHPNTAYLHRSIQWAVASRLLLVWIANSSYWYFLHTEHHQTLISLSALKDTAVVVASLD